MTLPLHLEFVRHGLSEGNHAQRLSERGNYEPLQRLLSQRHNRRFRLMPTGRNQAHATGEWLKKCGLQFDRYYVSEYTRALETATLLGLPEASWRVNDRLNERDTGDYHLYSQEERDKRFPGHKERRDAERFYWRPPGGESLYDLTARLDRFLETLHRECEQQNVLVVCHGEVMWMFRKILFRLTADQFAELHSKEQLHNGEVHRYTRVNPCDEADVRPYITWFQRVRPLVPTEEQVLPWKEITYHRFSNEALLEMVGQTPPLIIE